MELRKYRVLLWTVCITGILQAQPLVLDNRIPYRKGDLWGYCDSAKHIIVPPQYNSVRIINTQLLSGKDHPDGREDIYTFGGKFLCTINERRDFANGYAIVVVHGKSGLMDSTGRLVIAPKYGWMRDCREGMVICGNGPAENIIVDSTGREVITITGKVSAFYDGRAFFSSQEKHGSVDKNGNMTWFDQFYSYPSPEIDHHYVRIFNNENHGYGLMAMSGKTIVPPEYAEAVFSGGGTITVRIQQKYGMYDTSGKMILPVEYDKISPVQFNLHLPPEKRHTRAYFDVQKGTLHGMIDSLGKFILPVEYLGFSAVSEDIFSASQPNKCGHFHISGRVVTQMKYMTVGAFIDGIAWVKVNNKYQLVNEKGSLLNYENYDWVDLRESPGDRIIGDSVIVVGDKHHSGLVDYKGKERIPLDYYSIIQHNLPQRLRVKSDSLWGLRDLNGRLILSMEYTWIGFFSDGYAWALRSGKYVIVDLDGHEIIPEVACMAKRNVTYFKNGIAEVTVNREVTYVNTDGHVVAAQGNHHILWRGGSAGGWFGVTEGNKHGVLDENGQVVLPVKYDGEITRVTKRIYSVWQKDQTDYVNANGTEYFDD